MSPLPGLVVVAVVLCSVRLISTLGAIRHRLCLGLRREGRLALSSVLFCPSVSASSRLESSSYSVNRTRLQGTVRHCIRTTLPTLMLCTLYAILIAVVIAP